MRGFIILAAFFAALIFVGSGDYQDEKTDRAHYAQMVCDGYWPDYKNLKIDCMS